MTDNNKNMSHDDEYQFPKDEYVSSGDAKPELNETDESVQPKKKSVVGSALEFLRHTSFTKNKRILIVVVVVILLFVIFHFSNEKKPAPAPVASQPVVVTEPSNDSQVQGSLESLKSRTETQISDLQSQLSSIQNDVAQTQTENQALQKAISDLSVQVQGLSARLDTVLTKPAVKGKRFTYHLRAVLPDRAWITSSTGETKSVTIGDYVKQYGTVQQIDSQRGIITTSSGRKIVYGQNDY